MIFGLILVSIMTTADTQAEMPTADALQSDLQTAFSCQEIDGRKVWKGGLAYYIQSYVYDGQSSGEAKEVATDAVLPADNDAETMRAFEEACIAPAPMQIKAGE